jgi:hypothetical protein
MTRYGSSGPSKVVLAEYLAKTEYSVTPSKTESQKSVFSNILRKKCQKIDSKTLTNLQIARRSLGLCLND